MCFPSEIKDASICVQHQSDWQLCSICDKSRCEVCVCMVAHSTSLLFFNWPLLLDFNRQLHLISISPIRIFMVYQKSVTDEYDPRENVHLKINPVNFIHFLVTLPALCLCCIHWSTLFGIIEASSNRLMTLGWGSNVCIICPQIIDGAVQDLICKNDVMLIYSFKLNCLQY